MKLNLKKNKKNQNQTQTTKKADSAINSSKYEKLILYFLLKKNNEKE